MIKARMTNTAALRLAAKDYVVRVHGHNLLRYDLKIWNTLVESAERQLRLMDDEELLELTDYYMYGGF